MKLTVHRGDITKMGVDAIVNAANPSLLGGGGVDGAIHAAAGPELKLACGKLHGCLVGEAKITAAFKLPATYIIHTVGPIWQGGNEDEAQMLSSCYRNCLRLCPPHGIRSIAFPSISCGAYGYPPAEAARIAVTTVCEYNTELYGGAEHVYFVAFSTEMEQIYRDQVNEIS